MPFLGDAYLPAGLRIYAIGDVHGCLDRLQELHATIAADLKLSPVDEHRIVHCGDYVDRGTQSAGTIAYLIELTRDNPDVVCLYGNHEDELLGFLEDPDHWGRVWLTYGGRQTLESYGMDPGRHEDNPKGWLNLRDDFESLFPMEHRRFLQALPRQIQFGDFFFVHAGVRPGRPLPAQESDDLIWIREPFLSSASDHGAVIVHGHTPVEAREVHPNRINIDTGAVFGNALTCVVIEDNEIRFLTA